MAKRKRITFIASNASPASLRGKLRGKKVITTELWVRPPDPDATARRPTLRPARLCRCRSVCLAVVEDKL